MLYKYLYFASMHSVAQQLCGPFSAFAKVRNQQFGFPARARTVRRLQSCRRISVMALGSSGSSGTEAAAKYGWELEQKPDWSSDPKVKELPVASIRRPLQMTRSNDQDKVEALMKSIEEVGLHEPIDVLEVEGQYYGFSGCHRFEAHQRLGKETILCRVRKANKQALKFHMM